MLLKELKTRGEMEGNKKLPIVNVLCNECGVLKKNKEVIWI